MFCLYVQGWKSRRRMRLFWLVLQIIFGVKLSTTTLRYHFQLFMWFLFINFAVMKTCYMYVWFLYTPTAMFYLLEYTSITCNYKWKAGEIGPVCSVMAYNGVEARLCWFLTSTVDGTEWSTSCPGHFTPGKKSGVNLYRRLGGPQSWCGCFGEEEKLFSLLGLSPRLASL